MIEEILEERGDQYGSFTSNAKTSCALKRVLRQGVNWRSLTNEQQEALEVIMQKASRIVNGNPDYLDSWVDIEGYARLVSTLLVKVPASVQSTKVYQAKIQPEKFYQPAPKL